MNHLGRNFMVEVQGLAWKVEKLLKWPRRLDS
jgi:hypothetical protein